MMCPEYPKLKMGNKIWKRGRSRLTGTVADPTAFICELDSSFEIDIMLLRRGAIGSILDLAMVAPPCLAEKVANANRSGLAGRKLPNDQEISIHRTVDIVNFKSLV
jgi:hypothetical protein